MPSSHKEGTKIERTKWMMTRKYILLLTVVIMVAGVVACGKPAADTTYKLTHTAADAEYILSWDSIVAACPDIGAYEKQENFIHRGETKQISSTETSSMDMDSPSAWGSTRYVMTATTGEKVRGFGVWIMYCETDEYLDELLLTQTSGFPVQEDGDFVTGVVESGPPTQSVQLLLAGKHFVVLIMESASSDESLFLSKDKLMELLPGLKDRISSLEITTLPSDIPERKEEAPDEWHEFMTFSSDELSPPVRVPEEQHYNDLIFIDRPLMQVFNFTIDKDWRFVMTATGEVGTKFELFPSVLLPGEPQPRQIGDHVFILHSETVNVTREQPLEERYTPPVSIEVKVFFDLPMDWVMTIEK
jgi:hypothetical protein